MGQTDIGALVDGARAGDAQAWRELVERFLPLVCATIARQGVYGAEADDANQSVWLRLVEHLDDLREPRALPGWIVTTARRECLRSFDRSRRSVPLDPQAANQLTEAADEHELDEALLDDERQHAVRQGLAELPADRRELLLLLATDPPLTYLEISERLGIPVGSIGPTRARVLRQLRNTQALRQFAEPSHHRGEDRDVAR